MSELPDMLELVRGSRPVRKVPIWSVAFRTAYHSPLSHFSDSFADVTICFCQPFLPLRTANSAKPEKETSPLLGTE